jgi:hypothetical protein
MTDDAHSLAYAAAVESAKSLPRHARNFYLSLCNELEKGPPTVRRSLRGIGNLTPEESEEQRRFLR